MFQRDFVALGENQTRNFVARHKLGFNTTSSLCLGIELVGARVRVRVRVRIPRQIRYSSGTAPPQTCHKIRHRSATKSATDPAQLPKRLSSYTTVVFYICEMWNTRSLFVHIHNRHTRQTEKTLDR